MSVKDLKALGLKTQRIIATGSNTPIIIYSSSIDSDGAGGVTDSNLLSSVGTDTFLFVSGSKNSKDTNNRGVSLFGGDVVVSGTLYAERQVIEVDQSSPGALFVSGNLEVTGTTILNSNKTGNTEFVFKTPNKDYGVRFRSDNETIYFLSGGASSDHNEAEYQDTNFFVSGSIGSAHQPSLGQTGNGERGTGVFGGDLFVSGNMFTGQNLTIAGDLTVLGNQPDGLKSYHENGNFLPAPLASGTDSVAIGKDTLNNSNNSIVIGFENTSSNGTQSLDIFGGYKNYIEEGLHSSIFGGRENIISGSSGLAGNNSILGGYRNSIHKTSLFNTIIGGFSNTITSSADGVTILGSDSTVIHSKGLYGFADNLLISKNSNNNIVFGPNNHISSSDSIVSDQNVVLGNRHNVYNSSKNFILGQTFGSNDLVTIKSSNESFIYSSAAAFISSSDQTIVFSNNITSSFVSNSFINANATEVLDASYSSILASNNVYLSSSDYSSVISSKNIKLEEGDITSVVADKIASGISDSTLTIGRGFNAVINTDSSQISGSYNTILGGFKNIVSASMSSIYGGFNNQIKNEVSNSYSIGGNNNQITSNKSIILGSGNNSSGENTFTLGQDLINNSNSTVLIGYGQNNISGSKVILSSSMFEFGDLNTPKLYGSDTNFFVSGAVGSKNSSTRGTAVFGGDLHISGTLSGGGFIVDKLFFEGGDAKARDRSLGSTDNSDITLITNNEPRIKIGSNSNVTVGTDSVLHVTSGSTSSGKFEFNSSLDKSPANTYPFVISRTSPNNTNDLKEIGLAFISFPTSSDNILLEEPGAAITHYENGTTSQGGLKFKTKTTNNQYTLDSSAASLTTKLKISNLGELLLGNDNPDNQYIDLRVSGSDFPLISASGSLVGDRHVYLMKNDVNQNDTNFYVKGTPNSKNTSTKGTSVFGGDVHVSGSLYTDGNHTLAGDLTITGDIDSSDGSLEITADANNKIVLSNSTGIDLLSNSDINLTATNVTASNNVKIGNDLHVVGNITGSNIKGSGVEISNVNLSSTWVEDASNPGTYVVGDIIDGNTGLWSVNLGSFSEDVKKIHAGTMIASDLQWTYELTNNTRLYDTYLETQRDSQGRVQVINTNTGVISSKNISAERITPPEHLIISSK